MKIHVRIQEKTYEVIVSDLQSRPIQASVDGEIYEVWPEEMTIPPSPRYLDNPILPVLPVATGEMEKSHPLPSDRTKTVIAPLPGVIVEIHVSAGDRVTYGQELIVLEAMKMKNMIRSSREGIIEKLNVAVGEQVQHGTILMEYGE